MTSALFLLLQSVDPSSARDFGVYIADAAAMGAAGFAWRTNARLARIETILAERKTGVVDTVAEQGETIDDHGKKLERHETRLDGHDRELAHLNRDDERRRPLGPRDVGAPDRRSSP